MTTNYRLAGQLPPLVGLCADTGCYAPPLLGPKVVLWRSLLGLFITGLLLSALLVDPRLSILCASVPVIYLERSVGFL